MVAVVTKKRKLLAEVLDGSTVKFDDFAREGSAVVTVPDFRARRHSGGVVWGREGSCD